MNCKSVLSQKLINDIQPSCWAAEQLSLFFWQGAFPSPCGPAALSSLLDEEWVLNHVQSNDSPTKVRAAK